MAEQYNSNFTGPEIDAILGGAVRYDLAQSLTTAQQTQARGNIAAAPNGYGYGDNAHGFFANPDSDGSVATAFFNGLLDQMVAGTTIRGSFVDYPYIADTNNGGEYELYKDSSAKAIVTITIFGGGGAGPYRLTWTKYNNAWRAPEWTNPPLAQGVEYRTTERYFGKPVYIKTVNLGMLPNALIKTVAHGISDVLFCLRCTAHFDRDDVRTIPYIGQNDAYCSVYCDKNNINVRTSTNLTSVAAVATIWVIKTTD